MNQVGRLDDVDESRYAVNRRFHEISLGDQLVSRYHCWIKAQNDGAVVIEDLKSGNGTFVNGERVSTQRLLKIGDHIRVGATEFTFTAAA